MTERRTPRPFAYRIIKKLEHMGWITISRGAEGGCRLAADLKNVNLYELLEGIGADKDVSECLRDGYCCSRKGGMHRSVRNPSGAGRASEKDR